MVIPPLHRWKTTVARGRTLQERLSQGVRLDPLPAAIRRVAGADVAFDEARGVFFAAVVVFSLPDMDIVEDVSARHRPTFPYVPGMLSFREGPVLLAAFRKLRRAPDAVIFDGQGIAHPRRLGLAAHLGLWLDLPAVGCAKSRLLGEHDPVEREAGSAKPLFDGGERVGSVLRTRSGIRPVFVSPGHRCDFAGAERLVLECCRGRRLPEPTRIADIRVAEVKRRFLSRSARA